MKRSSSAVAGVWSCGGSAIAAHRPCARRPGPSTAASRPAARSRGHREAHRQGDPAGALGLLERAGVALEDPLAGLGDAQVAQHPGHHALAAGGRGAEHPGLLAGLGGGRRAAGQRVVRGRDREHLVVQEGLRHQGVRQLRGRRADRDVDRAGREQGGEPGRGTHAELDVEVGGPAGEQLDQARRGVLGEQAGGRHPQQPAAVPGLADLAHRAVLEAEDLHGPAGQPQPAGGERQPRGGAGEQLVVELLAQLGDVHGDRRLADRELVGGRLHRPQTHHAGEGLELRGGHVRTLRPGTPAARGTGQPVRTRRTRAS